MDFAICLDQFSTNFNVSSLSPNGFSIYTNLDYNNPIASGIPYQDLFAPPIGNCPLIVNVPQGATQILVIDACTTLPTNVAPIFNTSNSANSLITQCCYAIISVPAQPISWCDTSGLAFNVFSSSYVGQIVAGNLTSNIGTVTSYTIGWYLNGNYSSPVFTSGYGNAFLPYQNIHPLTGSSAVPVPTGNWEGIIHDIAINGVTYSSVSGSANGTLIPFESCFDTIVVSPLTCNNGPYSATSKYSHQINYNSQATGTTSAPVSFTYNLSSNTKYFAYAFKAFSVWDELEIKWKSGNPSATTNPSLYSQPIYLEKLKIGQNASGPSNASLYSVANGFGVGGISPNNYTLSNLNNVWPKHTTNAGYVQRLLTLTNLETSSNPSFPDFLEITVTPNPSNNNTQWVAGFQCLDTFNCTDCYTTNYSSSLPNIYKIRLEKQYGCDAQRIQLFVTGCYSPSDLIGNNPNQTNLPNPLMSSTWANIGCADLSYIGLISSPTDGIRLNGSITPYQSPTNVFYSPIPAGTYVNLKGQTSCATAQPGTIFCAPGSTGTITLNKTVQQIQLTFTLESDYLHYKNNLDGLMTTYGVTAPVACDSTGNSVSYFKYVRLSVPIQNTSTANCGDNTQAKTYHFHINDYFNITYVANPSANDPTVGFWSITIPQTPMVNCYPQLGCDSCYSSINTFVSIYNNIGSVTSPNTFTFTTNVGAKYDNPFRISYINKNTSPGLSGSHCPSATQLLYRGYSWYSTNTVPFISSSTSPTGWVNLPSLGSTFICGTKSFSEEGYGNLGGEFEQYLGGWQIRFPNLTSSFNYSTSTNDFEVYAFTGWGNTGSLHVSPSSPLPCPDPSGSKIYSYIGGVATVYTSSHFLGNTAPTLVIDP